MLYRLIIRPFLFLISPERVHYLVFDYLKLALKINFLRKFTRKFYTVKGNRLERNLFGLKFPNPVGLAAGFDKDGKLYEELSCFGFGFIEVGTVTPKAQDGNPQPRLFRLPKDKSLINRMGFNNAGVVALAERLKKRNPKYIIGGNIGKNKLTPNESAVDDYIYCFEQLVDFVDYFVVNVSSPNTPNLRDLQEKEPLKQLLMQLQEKNAQIASRKPILLKIAPDLSNSQLDDVIEIVQDTKIDGLIATNTTIDRSGLKTTQKELESIGAGGLSGKALTKRSTDVIRYLKEQSNHAFPIIAVGGIFTADDAIEKLEAGADLLQIYTGFIYEGPGIVKKINKGIKAHYESRKH
tara:strand:- start:98 stop:1150 length:1053 start_codon:yes stop_codon:yes gene_type:complete